MAQRRRCSIACFNRPCRHRRVTPRSRCSPRRSYAAADEASVQDLFRKIVDEVRPMWQRSALLRGAEVTLLSAAMPDPAAATEHRGARRSGGRRGHDPRPIQDRHEAPARGATVAGSSPAFPGTRPRDPNGRPAPSGPLRLRQEPALVAFAARDEGPLRPRVTALLERVEFPGKPGDRRDGAPDGRRTPAVRRRPPRVLEHLSGLSHAGRSRADARRARSRRIGARPRAWRGDDANHAAGQGRHDRA